MTPAPEIPSGTPADAQQGQAQEVGDVPPVLPAPTPTDANPDVNFSGKSGITPALFPDDTNSKPS